MVRQSLRRSLVGVMTLFVFLAQATWALASPTGGLHGTVLDASSHTPVAGATVTAISPSQTATAATDAHGDFNFLTLAPDT
ncbi:MAG: carboxypeptidase regulatory-like domain-containing protein, partial [Candidatus Eremiobacteraeota bacterium]|nr:carboxypeptidase regulatory-like domain-containing protein [Candidatus Eremiobacteraeota bacterium]